MGLVVGRVVMPELGRSCGAAHVGDGVVCGLLVEYGTVDVPLGTLCSVDGEPPIGDAANARARRRERGTWLTGPRWAGRRTGGGWQTAPKVVGLWQ